MKQLSDAEFDTMYGKGMMERVRSIINALAPTTRRDEWWETDGPYEIIAKHIDSPCIYEARPYPGQDLGSGIIKRVVEGSWCRTHGWDCPNAGKLK